MNGNEITYNGCIMNNNNNNISITIQNYSLLFNIFHYYLNKSAFLGLWWWKCLVKNCNYYLTNCDKPTTDATQHKRKQLNHIIISSNVAQNIITRQTNACHRGLSPKFIKPSQITYTISNILTNNKIRSWIQKTT